MIKYVGAVDTAAGLMFVKKLDFSNAWSNENPYGWTYQGVFGPNGYVVFECDTREEAEAKTNELLKSDCKGFTLYGDVRPVAKKSPSNAIAKVHFNNETKQGMIEFINGKTLPIYTGYKAIKMTDDHELNRIRLFLATFANPERTPETYGSGTWYSADFYVGKTDKYYKIIRHDGNTQSIIAKGYSADEVIANAFGRNPFHVIDWQNNFTREKYKAYITYLKFKNVCDKHIKHN